MSFSPGWAVGWHFVPIANLLLPYSVLREIYRASKRPENWRRERVPSTFPLWWSLWVLTTVIAWVSVRFSFKAIDLATGVVDYEVLLQANTLSFFVEVVSVPTAFASIAVIGLVQSASCNRPRAIGLVQSAQTATASGEGSDSDEYGGLYDTDGERP